MNILPDRDIITSALISIAAHALFLALAAFVCLGGVKAPPEEPKKEFNVKISSDKPLRRLALSRAGSVGPVTTVPGYGGPVSDTLATGIADETNKGL